MGEYLNASSCYFPDGTTTGAQTNPYFVPCDPTAPNSACCAIGESCTQNGLCYSDDGNIYRGACTDPKWGVGSGCASVCVSPSQTGYASAWSVLQMCGPYTGSPPGNTWQCDSNTSCENTFPLHVGPITALNVTGYRNTTTATSSGSNATATVTASCTAHADSTTALATGIGVGVPLIILFIAALGSALWYRRKWRSGLAGHNAGGQRGYGAYGAADSQQGDSSVHELMKHDARQPAELASDHGIAELDQGPYKRG